MAINHGASNLRLKRLGFVGTAQNNRGFTLVELLIVVSIIGVLATMAMVGFSEFINKAKVARCRSEIRNLEKEISAFATDQGKIPESLEQIGGQDLLDPWGSPYVYRDTAHLERTGPGLMNSDFDLYSKGPDGVTAPSTIDNVSLDDIIRADDGAFCDMASRYAL